VLIFAHPGGPPAPHDLWGAWNLDPALLAGLVLAAAAYRRGRAGHRCEGETLRASCFAGGLLVVAIALISPLDALSGALASAHMVQHVLLLLVAAPLLALSAPSSTLVRGSPALVRRTVARWRKRLRLTRQNLRALRHPATAWLLHVGTLWFWHAAVPYDAAIQSKLVHVLEHSSFLFTGMLFWRVAIATRSAGNVSHGLGVMLVFAMAMQSVFLSALLTFARTPWYSSYSATTAPWGLEPLGDQQLAGVIMWIPAGAVYLAAGLVLMAAWIRATEREDVAL
jgi:putative membrane protein